MQGKWIVLEGIEGCGKSSVTQAVGEQLRGRYPDRQIVICREPGGTPIAEQLRTLVKNAIVGEPVHIDAEILMFFAARVQLYHNVILPRLAEGCIVISDRNWISSLMYQGYGMGHVDKVQSLLTAFLADIPTPDLYVYLDVDYSISQQRTRTVQPDPDNIDSRGEAFFIRVINAYRQWALSGNDLVMTIDGNRPLDTVITTTLQEIDWVIT